MNETTSCVIQDNYTPKYSSVKERLSVQASVRSEKNIFLGEIVPLRVSYIPLQMAKCLSSGFRGLLAGLQWTQSLHGITLTGLDVQLDWSLVLDHHLTLPALWLFRSAWTTIISVSTCLINKLSAPLVSK